MVRLDQIIFVLRLSCLDGLDLNVRPRWKTIVLFSTWIDYHRFNCNSSIDPVISLLVSGGVLFSSVLALVMFCPAGSCTQKWVFFFKCSRINLGLSIRSNWKIGPLFLAFTTYYNINDTYNAPTRIIQLRRVKDDSRNYWTRFFFFLRSRHYHRRTPMRTKKKLSVSRVFFRPTIPISKAPVRAKTPLDRGFSFKRIGESGVFVLRILCEGPKLKRD